MSTSSQAPRVAIVGGGITGLAAAHRLHELAPQFQLSLFEAGSRLGGVVETVQRDGFLVERGADSFLAGEETPWAANLCRRIGLEAELISTSETHRGALVVFRGKPCPLPEGFTLMSTSRVGPVLTTPLLSWRGKLRLAGEYFVPRRTSTEDESLADFARRRLGREAYARIVQPLVGGIYTADPEQLSMQAALPQFVSMERQYGSLIRAARTRAAQRSSEEKTSGARYQLFVTPRDGLSSLMQRLQDRLPSGTVRLNAAVAAVNRHEHKWAVQCRGGQPELFDGVLVAAPAPVAADLMQPVSPALALSLRAIAYASATVVAVGYRREQVAHPLNAFGLVVPLCEQRRILAVSFTSVKFPDRAPAGSVLLRVFVGGGMQSQYNDLDDEALKTLVRQELAELLGVTGEPQFWMMNRWRSAMPQYHLGHLDRVARIESLAAELPGLELAGNAYRGVGLPYCVRSGEQAAERLQATMRASLAESSTSNSAPGV